VNDFRLFCYFSPGTCGSFQFPQKVVKTLPLSPQSHLRHRIRVNSRPGLISAPFTDLFTAFLIFTRFYCPLLFAIMLGHQFAFSTAPIRKVKEVQFGILSPEEIVRHNPSSTLLC
jgi:hypothetical protein